MKKVHSVTVKIGICLISALIVYSTLLLVEINRRLTNGFIENAEEAVYEEEESVALEVNNQRETLKNTMLWLKNSYQAAYAEKGNNLLYINNQCRGAANVFGIDSIIFYDAAGNQLSSTEFGKTITPSVKSNALAGIASNILTVENGDVYADSGVSVEVGGKKVGAIVGRKKITTDEFVEEISEFTNMEFTVFDGYTRKYTSIDGMKDTKIVATEIIDKALTGENVLQQAMINNKKYLVNYYPFKDDDGKILAIFFLGELINEVKEYSASVVKPLSIMSMTLTLLLLIVIAFVFYRLVSIKVKEVNNAIIPLSSGDADLTMRVNVKGNDEFAEVGENVNKFIKMLQEIIIKLNGAQSSLQQIGDNLGSNALESSSATAEIMANIESVRKQTITQNQAVRETTDVLSKSTYTVEDLLSLVNKQVAGISESSAAIEEMLGNINSVTNSVKKMSDSFRILDANVSDSNKKIGDVTEKVTIMATQSQTLLQANDMIAQVASQTNLLAMNAAIEAAHAGEAGKGFSVVADEIRKLAETSSLQSKNINAELKSISESIQSVVRLSNDSQTAFSAIVSQLGATDTLMQQINNAMEEQEVASHQILDSLGQMKSQASDVNDKSNELNAGIMNVQKNMDSVSQISDVILGSMDEMAAGSEQINQAAQSVSGLANQTKANIAEMDTLLHMFKA